MDGRPGGGPRTARAAARGAGTGDFRSRQWTGGRRPARRPQRPRGRRRSQPRRLAGLSGLAARSAGRRGGAAVARGAGVHRSAGAAVAGGAAGRARHDGRPRGLRRRGRSAAPRRRSGRAVLPPRRVLAMDARPRRPGRRGAAAGAAHGRGADRRIVIERHQRRLGGQRRGAGHRLTRPLRLGGARRLALLPAERRPLARPLGLPAPDQGVLLGRAARAGRRLRPQHRARPDRRSPSSRRSSASSPTPCSAPPCSSWWPW